MTIEAKLEALTAAILGLTAAYAGGATPAAQPAVTKPATGKAKPVAADTQPAAETEKALTYDDVKKPFLQLVQTAGRDIALATLQPFGHENLKTVNPDQFKTVLDAINAAIETAKAEGDVA